MRSKCTRPYLRRQRPSTSGTSLGDRGDPNLAEVPSNAFHDVDPRLMNTIRQRLGKLEIYLPSSMSSVPGICSTLLVWTSVGFAILG